MDFVLRRADLEDLDAVMALEEAGFVPGIVERREVFAGRLAAFPPGFLLAVSDARAVGYVCAEVWATWSASTALDPRHFALSHDLAEVLDLGGDTLYIASMTVDPEWRGQGLGRALFRRCLVHWLAEFPQLRRAVLLVNEHWTAARRVYAGEGFTEAGRLPAFFRPHQGPSGDALVLQKETGSA